MHEKVTGIIIAGGKSSRMGENKALVKYKHERLIDCAIRILDPVVDFLIISSNESLPKIPYIMVKDEVKGIGPLGGLYTALKKSKTEKNVVIACDTPNLTSDFYEKLLRKCKDCDAIIPEHSEGKLEPLVAVYSKNILPVIEEQIKVQDYKLMNLIKKINVSIMPTKHSSMFKNVNTQADLNN